MLPIALSVVREGILNPRIFGHIRFSVDTFPFSSDASWAAGTEQLPAFAALYDAVQKMDHRGKMKS